MYASLKESVGKILQPHLANTTGRSWQDCFDDKDNIFFVNEDNLAFFEKEKEGVYFGHYFFNTLRGRDALDYANEVLGEMFKKAEVIQGLTPVANKKAIIMSRWLGFSSYGTIDTIAGEMVLFILTKNEWINK